MKFSSFPDGKRSEAGEGSKIFTSNVMDAFWVSSNQENHDEACPTSASDAAANLDLMEGNLSNRNLHHAKIHTMIDRNFGAREKNSLWRINRQRSFLSSHAWSIFNPR